MNKDEVKKSPKANLERHRNTYILMGMVLGISLLFFAFEWSTETRKLDENVLVADVTAEEEIEITRREPPPPPPPPPPEPETPEIIEVVLEEIVGEIIDEFDSFQPSLFTRVGKRSYLFAGKISINDFCKAIGLPDDKLFEEVKGDADTLAGMLIEIAGHLPKQGEKIKFQNYIFVVEKADNRRIEIVKLTIKID